MIMYIVDEKRGKSYALPAKDIRYIGAPLAGKILALLAKRPTYPREIATTLREEEQKIYYHVRKLEKLGMIKIVSKEERGGAIAKYYALSRPAFVFRFSELKETKKIPHNSFPPFIEDGEMNAKIIIGSPDPHGPEKARSRDAHYAIDLGLFLGTFLINSRPSVFLDTEIRDGDLNDNLMIIGGPVTNRICAKINDKLPVKFDEKRNIFSTKTRRTYKSDDVGFVLKAQNPFAKNKSILVIAGRRYSGTRAAIIALIKNFDVLKKNNAVVVQGLDRDYDGVIDDAEILE